MRFGLKIILLSLLTFFLAACQDKNSIKTENVIKVGTIAGPETQLMEVAKNVAATQYGLDIEIVAFSDYNLPNEALNDGNIDANVFQHLPYLQQSMEAHGYQLKPLAKTFIYPMGLYSTRYHSLNDIPANSTIAIPNDPSNEARALLLLQAAQLIELKNAGGFTSTPMDIMLNPKNLVIKPIDAAQLTRALPDVALAAINTNYAAVAHLSPTKNELWVEDKNSPYANLIVVRANQPETVNQQHLVDALHSPEVIAEANKLFNGQAIQAW